MHWNLGRRRKISHNILESYCDQLRRSAISGSEQEILAGGLEEALDSRYITRRSVYRALGGDAATPLQIGAVNLEEIDIDSFFDSSQNRLLFYFFEHENDTFTDEDVEDRTELFGHVDLRRMRGKINQLLRQFEILDYELFSMGPRPISYGIRHVDPSKRTNVSARTKGRVLGRLNTLVLGNVSDFALDYSMRIAEQTIDYIFSFESFGKYAILGGNEELPSTIGDIEFHDGRAFVGNKSLTIDSGLFLSVLFMVEHLGEMYSSEELQNVGDLYGPSRNFVSKLRGIFSQSKVYGFQVSGSRGDRRYSVVLK